MHELVFLTVPTKRQDDEVSKSLQPDHVWIPESFEQLRFEEFEMYGRFRFCVSRTLDFDGEQ